MAADAVCPFCYQRIDPSGLWYQCLGRNGKCKKAVDPERLRLTKSTIETFPVVAFGERHVGSNVCPRCQGETAMRACSACHVAVFDGSSGQAFAYTACPYCGTSLSLSKLWYQCLGLGNGRCKKAVDPVRQRVTTWRGTSYSAIETFPSFPPTRVARTNLCPSCGGQTNLRACPACHTGLPVHFRDSAIFGLVGSRGSGKTVLMTVLVKELRGAIARHCEADISLATDNPEGLAGEGDYKAKRENSLYKDGVLPPPTAVLGAGRQHSASVLLRWRREALDSAGQPAVTSTMVSFVDSAGEQGNSLTAAFDLDYLEVCDGLIVVLDPFALPSARAMPSLPAEAVNVDDEAPLDVVRVVTEKLQVELGLSEGRKIQIPAAVVFTKIDAFFTELDRLHSPLMTAPPDQPSYSEEDGQRVHENIRSLLNQRDAQDIDAHIRMNYADYRYFGVSALGAEPDYQDHKVAPGGIRPHRVGDPVLWLLSKKGTVDGA
jgi:hypothetical protein